MSEHELSVPDVYRDHECMACQHKWSAQVRLSVYTQNLSGEATEWCPRCGSRAVVSTPAYNIHEVKP